MDLDTNFNDFFCKETGKSKYILLDRLGSFIVQSFLKENNSGNTWIIFNKKSNYIIIVIIIDVIFHSF